MQDISKVLAVLDEASQVVCDAVVIIRHHPISAIGKIFDAIRQLELLIKNLPGALPELVHLDGEASGALASAVYVDVKKIVDAIKG